MLEIHSVDGIVKKKIARKTGIEQDTQPGEEKTTGGPKDKDEKDHIQKSKTNSRRDVKRKRPVAKLIEIEFLQEE